MIGVNDVVLFCIIIILLVVIIILFILASLLKISIQPSGFYQNTVGYRQDVICSIFLLPDVDPDTIDLGWLNEDDIITDDSRVTVIESSDVEPVNSSSYFSITKIIRFDPLYENDNGTYTCYSIVNESESFTSIQLQNFRSKYIIFVYMYISHNTYNYAIETL